METLDYIWIIAAFLGTWIVSDVIITAVRVDAPRIYIAILSLIGALAAYTILIQ